MPVSEKARRLLAVDSTGGLLAGILVIIFRNPLSTWENLPPALLLATGAANIIYGLYSGWLAYLAYQSKPVNPAALRFLVAANACWTLVSLALAVLVWPRATVWGIAHLIGEGIYVGVLARVESQIFFTRI